MSHLFSGIAIFCYSVSLIYVILGIFNQQGPNRKLITTFASAAVIMHCASLSQAIFTPEGQNFSITNVISLINFCISCVFTLLMFRIKTLTIVPAVYSCSILSVLSMSLLPSQHLTHFEMTPEIFAHITLSIVAYSILMISALYAIQLQVTQYLLKQKKVVLNSSLPSLMSVEKHVLHLVLVGVIVLSLSLATGFIFIEHFLGQGIAHKTILSICAWCVYMVMLWKHYQHGCGAKMAVVYTLLGGTLLSVGYFGARIVKELILS